MEATTEIIIWLSWPKYLNRLDQRLSFGTEITVKAVNGQLTKLVGL